MGQIETEPLGVDDGRSTRSASAAACARQRSPRRNGRADTGARIEQSLLDERRDHVMAVFGLIFSSWLRVRTEGKRSPGHS
jgi:hypothetical protein